MTLSLSLQHLFDRKISIIVLFCKNAQRLSFTLINGDLFGILPDERRKSGKRPTGWRRSRRRRWRGGRARNVARTSDAGRKKSFCRRKFLKSKFVRIFWWRCDVYNTGRRYFMEVRRFWFFLRKWMLSCVAWILMCSFLCIQKLQLMATRPVNVWYWLKSEVEFTTMTSLIWKGYEILKGVIN